MSSSDEHEDFDTDSFFATFPSHESTSNSSSNKVVEETSTAKTNDTDAMSDQMTTDNTGSTSTTSVEDSGKKARKKKKTEPERHSKDFKVMYSISELEMFLKETRSIEEEDLEVGKSLLTILGVSENNKTRFEITTYAIAGFIGKEENEEKDKIVLWNDKKKERVDVDYNISNLKSVYMVKKEGGTMSNLNIFILQSKAFGCVQHSPLTLKKMF